MPLEAYNPYTNADVTSLEEVVTATKAVGHEKNSSLKATEHMEGYIEAFYAVSRDGGAVDAYEDAQSFDLPANAIPTEVLVDVTEAKVGSGTLTVKVGSTTVATVTSAGTSFYASPGGLRSSSAQAITFNVTTDVITAGAVRVRIKYLRGGPNS